MDKNTITGFILLALLTVGYVFYSTKEQAKLEQQRALVETISKINNADSATSGISVDTNTGSALQEGAQPESVRYSFEQGESNLIQVENEDVIYTFDTKGGTIRSVELKHFKKHDQTPLVLFDDLDNKIDFSFIDKDNEIIHTSEAYFSTIAQDTKISEGESQTIEFVLDFANGAKYIHAYTIHGKGYLLDFEVKSNSANQFISPLASTLDINWSQDMPSLEDNIKEERMYSNLYYRNVDKQVHDLSSRKNEEKVVENGLQWVSFKQKFFNNTLISIKTPFRSSAKLSVQPNVEDADIVKKVEAQMVLPINKGQDFNFEMQWFYGPNKYTDLKKLKIGLDEVIPLGWAIFGWVNKFLIIPIFTLLNKFIGNYGIIILILTILLKLVLTPLNRKQLVSTAKMKILRPEIDELKKKYPNDKQMVGAKQMELFRNAGVNPMGGCFPILLQMPILFAMYRFFPNSIELRQEAFLWADDLSRYDSIFTLPFHIPIYGDHVSLFTLLMAITSVAYSRIAMSQQQSMSMGGSDDMMAMQMKLMPYITPFMFLFMFNSFSAALSYYYFLFNLLSIIQTYVIQKFFIDESVLKAEIESNKKKPKKQSGWQQRMQEMMEQQKEAQKRK